MYAKPAAENPAALQNGRHYFLQSKNKTTWRTKKQTASTCTGGRGSKWLVMTAQKTAATTLLTPLTFVRKGDALIMKQHLKSPVLTGILHNAKGLIAYIISPHFLTIKPILWNRKIGDRTLAEFCMHCSILLKCSFTPAWDSS
jgi:hypothetical protein